METENLIGKFEALEKWHSNLIISSEPMHVGYRDYFYPLVKNGNEITHPEFHGKHFDLLGVFSSAEEDLFVLFIRITGNKSLFSSEYYRNFRL